MAAPRLGRAFFKRALNVKRVARFTRFVTVVSRRFVSTMTAADAFQLSVCAHPLLDVAAFVTEWNNELSSLSLDPALTGHFQLGAQGVTLESDDTVRAAIRDLLRHGGYKPTGRGKPASEYLLRSAEQNALSSINIAVDLCNIVSLHSGLPISVIDLDRSSAPHSLRIADDEVSYVFNASGQVISVGGLLCLCDNDGPCANAVKDSQRTKTHGATKRTLSVVWGARALADRTEQTTQWYEALCRQHGGHTKRATLIES